MTDVTIPNRPVFRATEVCEIAQVQGYVLRSWEAEFPDLGFAKTPSSPRMYRRSDVQRVLQLKHLLFVDGLTLAGARRKLGEDAPPARVDEPVDDSDIAAMLDEQTQQGLRDMRRGLQWILGVLSGDGITAEDRVLRSAPTSSRAHAHGRKAAPARSRKAAPAKSRKAAPAKSRHVKKAPVRGKKRK